MIDPQKCVKEILRNAPSELAVPLFDLMVWMADQPDFKDNSEYLAALNAVYLNLDHCLEGREAYADERVRAEDLPSVDVMAATQSN